MRHGGHYAGSRYGKAVINLFYDYGYLSISGFYDQVTNMAVAVGILPFCYLTRSR